MKQTNTKKLVPFFIRSQQNNCEASQMNHRVPTKKRKEIQFLLLSSLLTQIQTINLPTNTFQTIILFPHSWKSVNKITLANRHIHFLICFAHTHTLKKPLTQVYRTLIWFIFTFVKLFNTCALSVGCVREKRFIQNLVVWNDDLCLIINTSLTRRFNAKTIETLVGVAIDIVFFSFFFLLSFFLPFFASSSLSPTL